MIELIIVIVILGILAAVALPKFLDISGDAKLSAAQGVAGALASASSINYGGCLVKDNVVTANKCSKVSACTDTKPLMQGGDVPDGYTVGAGSGTGTSTVNGTNLNCQVTTASAAASAPFTAIAAGN
jgi:MSHA pilin protein MshA